MLFYKLDEAIDYMNELLSRSHQAREENNVNLMRLTATPEPTPEVEDLLTELSKPLDTGDSSPDFSTPLYFRYLFLLEHNR